MIRAAIIGLGPHGMRMLESALLIDSIKLIAVVDSDESKLNQEIVLKTEAIKLKDLAELWLHQIDLLMIATNGPSHFALSMEGIRNGITHLLISKPMTTSVADAIAINKAATEKEVRVCVDHILRYDETYQWIKTQINNNRWGKIRRMYIQRPGIGLGCLGVHSFDMANYLIGKHPRSITGWLDEPISKNPRGEQFVDPGGLVVLDYGEGIRATVDQVEDGCGPAVTEIIFNHARVRVDEKNNILEVIEKDPEFVPGPNRKAPLTRFVNPHLKDVKHDMVWLLKAITLELISDTPLLSDGDTGQNTIEILVAAYISNSNGNKPVELPLTEPDYLKLNLNIT
jgi:predicted dehydrogenase